MSNVSEAFERLQGHLAQGQLRAERLARLLGSEFDEAGHRSLFARPEARALLAAAMVQASDAAADLGIELFDFRWNAVVTLLHNAGQYVRGLDVRGCAAVALLLEGLQYRVLQLRVRRFQPVKVTMS